MELQEAIRTRTSIRAFKPDPVPFETVKELLEIAARAPSGTNVQPWKVHVVAGKARDELVEKLLAYREENPTDTAQEFDHSNKRVEPYITRMRTLGKEMYGLIGIPKGDKERSWEQWGRNYKFFDAPVGLIFTVDKDLDARSWLDIGMFMQTFMLAAKERGLDTCAQGAWNMFWKATREILNVPEEEYIICGMSLGYADPDDPVNKLISEREPVEGFTTFHGYAEASAETA